MLKIAVFDTEANAAQLEQALIRLLFDRCEFGYEAYTDPRAASQIDFANGFPFDIAFIEVDAAVFPGVGIAEKIRESGNIHTEIVILSADDSYLLYGYKLHVFDYLIKPASIRQLSETIDRYFAFNEADEEKFFSFKVNGSVQRIRLDDVYYFMSTARKCSVIHRDGDSEFYAKLDEVEAQLDSEEFIRVHQSYIVRIRYIKSLTKDGLTMTNGLFVPISQRRYGSVKAKFMQFLNINE
jgi:DNA-binding LytR/AlgR family response regulator